jgi:hypothetical protein
MLVCWVDGNRRDEAGQSDDSATDHAAKSAICADVVIRGEHEAIEALFKHIVDPPCNFAKDYGVRVRGNEKTGVKGRQDIRWNVELILGARGKESLLGAEIKKSEAGRVLHLTRKSILRFGVDVAFRWAGLSHPLVITCCVFLQPEEKVKILGTTLYEQKPFFEVLEAQWRKVFSIENVV